MWGDRASTAGSGLGSCAAAWARAHRVQAGPWAMRYRTAGTGPAVVLVHGLGVSADYWWRNGPAIAAAGYRVLAPDLPGFGRTAGPAGGSSVPEQALQLRRWAEAVDLGPAVYVGHSLSCQVNLELAAAYPERVRGLVLAAPTGDPVGSRLLRQAVGLVRDIHRESLPLAVLVAQAYLRAGPVRVLQTWRKGAGHDPMPLLPRVRAPAVVVVGTRDPVVRPEFARALAAGLPHGRLAWIADAAHAVIFEPATEFNRAVLEFLEGIGHRG